MNHFNVLNVFRFMNLWRFSWLFVLNCMNLLSFNMLLMDYLHNLLMLWFVVDFYCVKLSLNVRNVMSLHLGLSFLMLLRVFSNDLLLMMCCGRLQLNWGFYSLYNCFNMLNSLRFLVISNFIVLIIIIWLAFLNL